jgi:hypothetical protein
MHNRSKENTTEGYLVETERGELVAIIFVTVAIFVAIMVGLYLGGRVCTRMINKSQAKSQAMKNMGNVACKVNYNEGRCANKMWFWVRKDDLSKYRNGESVVFTLRSIEGDDITVITSDKINSIKIENETAK